MAVCDKIFLKSLQVYLFRQNEFNSVSTLSQMALLMAVAECHELFLRFTVFIQTDRQSSILSQMDPPLADLLKSLVEPFISSLLELLI